MRQGTSHKATVRYTQRDAAERHAGYKTLRAELVEIGALLRVTPGSFAVRVLERSNAISVTVEGQKIGLPVPADQVEALCQRARPARHGYKDETRLDPGVRDTWEIPGSQIVFSGADSLPLEQLRIGLGLPRGCHLQAQLYNLLIYKPGQFFAPHQDLEKSAGMIGTLVLILPSGATGGDLVIEHQGERKVFVGSPVDLTLIAFYADCRHEVQPVRDGHRVALTFNLSLEGTPVVNSPAATTDRLTTELGRLFNLPAAASERGDAEVAAPALRQEDEPEQDPPRRLVFLLDHQYTRAGLGWDSLKGADVASAAALREAAARLDCEMALTLADVHEGWIGEDKYHEHGPAREGWNKGDAVDRIIRHAYGGPVPTCSEVFSSLRIDIELRHWVGTGEPPIGVQPSTVDPQELCCSFLSSALRPFRSAVEPYLGNEGGTVERWFHRAAIVIWPRDQT